MFKQKTKDNTVENASNVQSKEDSATGQGSDKSGLVPRGLNRSRTKNPNEVPRDNPLRACPNLYARVITPREIEVSRVIAQVSLSESKQPFSSQLNNEINPTMENKDVEGGDREVI